MRIYGYIFSSPPQYYSPWVSLLGAVLCVAVMFLIQWYTALATFVIVGVLYLYISYRKPEANWGSSTQAQQFVLTLKNLQSLNDVPDHVKNYRPKVLVFSGIPAHRQPLVDFANLITKKLSLLICSHIETVSRPGYSEKRPHFLSLIFKKYLKSLHYIDTEMGCCNICKVH